MFATRPPPPAARWTSTWTTGEKRAALQKAQGIRATRRAYRDNPAQARIDAIRALPEGVKALGGDVSSIVGGEP